MPLKTHHFGRAILPAAAIMALYVTSVAAQGTMAHPPLAPSRDVTVDYAVQPQGAPVMPVSVSFSGDGNLLRITGNDGKSITILDRQAQQVTLVSMAQKVYMQFSPRSGLRNPFLLSLGMHYTPAGSDTVAGVACRKWSITSDHGKAEACVTDDGVILRESGVDADGAQGQLLARRVDYAPVPSSAFQPPPGFERIQPHPQGGPAQGGPVQGGPGLAPGGASPR